MKKLTIFLSVLVVVFLSSTISSIAYDATGIWNYTEHSLWNNCGDQNVPESGEVGILQTGSTFLVVDDDFSTYGNVTGNTYSYSDTFCEEGGLVSGNASITLTSENSANGTVTWTWSGSGESCSGGYQVTLTKQTQAEPVYDATGKWNFNQSGFSHNCGSATTPRSSGFFQVTQTGKKITAVDDQGEQFSGFVNGAEYAVVRSWELKGGRNTEWIIITLSSGGTQGNGTAEFVWDDNCDDCGGSWSISVTKEVSTPTKNAMPWIPLLLLDGGGQKVDQLVYVSDEGTAGVYELYLVSSDKPGIPTKLNPQLVNGGDVRWNFNVSPDGSQVAYVADQDTDNVMELYLVDLSNPGVSTKFNAPLVAGGNVSQYFAFSPDGSQVAYVADQDTDDDLELYIVDLSNPGVSTKLSAPLVAFGDVFSFAFSPDGSQVVYRADQDTENIGELYMVDLSNPGVSIRLNAPLVAGGSISSGFVFSPDSSQVAYRADQDTAGVYELYLVDLSNPGVSTNLNAPLVAGRLVFPDFSFSPDSSKVAYVADQDTDNVMELYLVDLSNPGVSIKLNAPLVAGGHVYYQSFAFSPDGSQVVYWADQDTDNVYELYLVDLSNPGVSTNLSAPLVADRDVREYFEFSPDGSQVVYCADQDTDNVYELYLVDLSNPGVSTKIDAPLVADRDVIYSPAFSPDGSRVAYVTVDSPFNFSELRLVDLDTPGVGTVLNNPLPLSSVVFSFSFVPGQTLYTAPG